MNTYDLTAVALAVFLASWFIPFGFVVRRPVHASPPPPPPIVIGSKWIEKEKAHRLDPWGVNDVLISEVLDVGGGFVRLLITMRNESQSAEMAVEITGFLALMQELPR